MIALIVVGLLGFAAVGAGVYWMTIYNGLIVVKNDILKAWANIDVLLKQRHDEIPKIVKACEAYMQYEKGALAKVIELRGAAQNAQGVEAKAQAEGELSAGLRQVFALAEHYPQLQAQSSFQQLQSRISDLENQLADRREFYNESVNTYNIRIQSFPDSVVAGKMGLAPREMFRIADEDKKDAELDIKVP